MLCKIKKSLYGLKQASRQWFSKLTNKLHNQGFLQSKNDYSFFIKKNNDLVTFVAVYVDDIVLTGDDTPSIIALKTHHHNVFSIKVLGHLTFFLGIENGYLPQGITMTQSKFTKELLSESGTPLPINLKLKQDDSPPFHDPSL